MLERIKETGDIFFAVSDREWVLDGAMVHISMAGFDRGEEKDRLLDGEVVPQIHTNLRSTTDTTKAKPIAANLAISFMGDTKGGAFDVSDAQALVIMQQPNPHGRPNSDVIVPWINGLDVTRRSRDMWIIDFGTDKVLEEAASYEAPFDYVSRNVLPEREKNNRQSYRERWWIHVESRPAMRQALSNVNRFIGTTTVSKHRLFGWFESPVMPDHQLIIFARSDDWFFGLLHSRVHETWARAQGTQLREVESGFRYTPSSCFETFPFPQPTGDQEAAIAAAAKELDELRSRWLNPPEWTRTEVLEFPGSLDGPWSRYIDPATVRPLQGPHPNSLPEGEGTRGIGTVRWPRTVPKDAECGASLKKRA